MAIPLETLEKLIKLAHEINDADEEQWNEIQGTCQSLVKAAKARALAGSKLLDARTLCSHGQWLRFLEQYCPQICRVTAHNYMRFAETWPDVWPALQALVNVQGLERMEKLRLAQRILRLAGETQDSNDGLDHAEGPVAARSLLRWADWLGKRVDRVQVDSIPEDARERLRVRLEPAVRLYEQLRHI